MVHFMDFGVGLWIISLIFLLYGVFYLIKSITKVEDKFRPALLFMLFAFLVHLLEAFLDWFLIYLGLSFESGWWLFSPVLNVLVALFLLLGVRKFHHSLDKA